MKLLKKYLLFTICILAIACRNTGDITSKSTFKLIDSIYTAEGFDTTVAYLEPSCLYYKNKPLFTIGQNIKQLDTSFSFRYDPNGKYEKSFPTVKDYLSLDDFYSAKLSTGLINGALYFTADSNGTIFRFAGEWFIDGDLVDTSGMEILSYIHDQYFPCLPPDIRGKQTFELTHKNFVEQFKLIYFSKDTAEKSGDTAPYWSLRYSVTMTKKKNGM